MEDSSAILILIFIALGLFWMIYSRYINNKKKVDFFYATRDAYYKALETYASSQEMNHKIQALHKGREFAALCREQGAVSIFDEVRLNNDIMVRTK